MANIGRFELLRRLRKQYKFIPLLVKDCWATVILKENPDHSHTPVGYIPPEEWRYKHSGYDITLKKAPESIADNPLWQDCMQHENFHAVLINHAGQNVVMVVYYSMRNKKTDVSPITALIITDQEAREQICFSN